LVVKTGGWSAIQAALPPEYFQPFGRFGYANGVSQGFGPAFSRAMEIFLPTMLLLLGNQTIYQKFFAARTARDAKLAVVGWIAGTVLLETLIVAIAVVGAALFLHNGDVKPREIIPYTARHGLPALLGAIMMGAVFAKVISTANNYLFSPSTNLVNDIYARFISKQASDRKIVIVSRVIVVLLGLFALLQATAFTSILEAALYAYTIYSAAITPVVMAAFFWRRATGKAAVVSILLGTLITVFWKFQQKLLEGKSSTWLPEGWLQHDAIYPALIISLFSLVAISLFTSAPRREQWEPFMAEERAPASA
jgi:Na+/proline symporter